jgi:2-hydroxychromene-2-carboxylate isomerase
LANIPFNPNRTTLDAVLNGSLSGNWLVRVGIAARQLYPSTDINLALFQVLWNGTGDLLSEGGRKRFLSDLGINGGDIWKLADRNDIMEVANANEARAIDLGVFGVPTFFFEEEMFFGNDRVDLMLRKMKLTEEFA